MKPVPTTTLPGGEKVPLLGMGTWRMGESREKRRAEVAALRTGIELGMTLIDTAEMYANGGAEEVAGEAIKDCRDDVFVVSKFYPHNATPERMAKACERSLRRLGTDRIDLYLVHWRGDVSLRETLDGFEELLRKGKIRYAGVSNFDLSDMTELFKLKDGPRIVTDQVLYNLERRGPEVDLLPWLRRRHRPLMAYSPLEEGLCPTASTLHSRRSPSGTARPRRRSRWRGRYARAMSSRYRRRAASRGSARTGEPPTSG